MSKMPLDCVIKNGKLYNTETHEYAIIVTKLYGHGWSTQCHDDERELSKKRLFSPSLAKAILTRNNIEAKRAILKLSPKLKKCNDLQFREQCLDYCLLSLKVEFVDDGCVVKVKDHDGLELYECIPWKNMYYAG